MAIHDLQFERGQQIDRMKEIRKSAEDSAGWTPARRDDFDEAQAKSDRLKDKIDQGLAVEKVETIGAPGFHVGHGSDYTGSDLGLRSDQSVGEYVRGNNAFNSASAKPNLSLGECVRGMFYPEKVRPEVRAALNEGTDSQGGYLTPVILAAQFIDKLRANLVTMQAGASTVPLQSDNHDFARLDTDPAGAWLAEGTTGSVTDAVFGRVRFQPKTYRGLFVFSGEIAQDAPNLDQVLDRAINNSFARPIDQVALDSTGGTLKPTGILQTTSCTVTNLTTANNTITNWSHLTGLVDRLRRANVTATGAICHPRDYGKFTTLSSTQDGQPLMRPELIRDLPLLDTTSMPTDRVNASSTSSNGSSIIAGNWADLVLGTRLDLRLIPVPNYKPEKFQHALLAVTRLDWKLWHAASFQKTDKLNTT